MMTSTLLNIVSSPHSSMMNQKIILHQGVSEFVYHDVEHSEDDGLQSWMSLTFLRL